MKTVLSICDKTGNMVRPWAEAGHPCICVDVQHEGTRTEGNVTFVGADVFQWNPPSVEYAIAFAFSPCTDLAASGARWFSQKGIDRLHAAICLVKRCVDICRSTGAPWLLENPVGSMN